MTSPSPIELQRYLQGVDYPVSKAELLEAAQRNGAPDDVLDSVRSAGSDTFNDPTEVSRAVT